MSIVYYSLIIRDQKKIIKSLKSKTIGEIVKSQLKEEYVIENIVVGQTIVKEDGDSSLRLTVYLLFQLQKRQFQSPNRYRPYLK